MTTTATSTPAVAPSLGASIASYFKGLAGVIAADAADVVVPLLQQANTKVASNPTALNAASQLASVQVQLIAAAPSELQDVLISTAGVLNDLLQVAVNDVAAFAAANPLPAAASSTASASPAAAAA